LAIRSIASRYAGATSPVSCRSTRIHGRSAQVDPFVPAKPLPVRHFQKRLRGRIVADLKKLGKLIFLHPAHPPFGFGEHHAFPPQEAIGPQKPGVHSVTQGCANLPQVLVDRCRGCACLRAG
jgi:hypothetical protein